MNLTTKISMTLFTTFTGLAAVLFALSQTVLLGSYKALDEEDARRNVSRALSALDAELNALASLNVDWAYWNDTYEFMAGKGAGYVTSNLNAETLSKQRLSLIAYMSPSGDILYGRSIDHREVTMGALPKGFITHITGKGAVLDRSAAETGVEGILDTEEGLMLVSSRPVLTSEGKGPARGSLVMARYLDGEEIRRLGEITHMPVSIRRVSEMPHYIKPGPEEADGGGRVSVAAVAEDRVVGMGIVDDIYGVPLAAVRVDLPRSIYIQGKNTTRYFILCLLGAAAVSTFSAMVILRKGVISRLVSIGTGLREIGRSGDLSMRVDVKGSDELTLLGGEVNKMLGSLEAIADERRRAEERLRKAHDELEERVKERTAELHEANLSLKEEVARRIRMEETIREMANYDSLTGLPNRVLFIDRLNQVIARGQWHGEVIAGVLFLDLDNFKVVNDTLGYAAGDDLIRHVAGRMREALRTGDTVARFGGDEFAVLLRDLARTEDIPMVIEKVFNSLRKPVDLGGHEVFVNASIGVSVYPRDGRDSATLLKNADIAMYHAKGKGGDGFQMYSPSMAEKAMERLTVGNRLRGALERKELVQYYQPLIDTETGAVFAAEALLRWQDPEKGLILPADFIPVAEETGIIVPMSGWGLREACEFTRRLQKEGEPGLSVSVNVSARSFMEGSFVDTVASVLGDTGLEPARLKLEIMESLLMRNLGEAMSKMRELKRLGVGFSIDDFGTGYSSLGYLKSLPIDQLKIDRSFVRDIANKEEARLIATAIIKLAQSMDLDVIAEGVETEEELRFLQSQGCRYIQGYLFSKPLPPDEYAEFLRNKRPCPRVA